MNRPTLDDDPIDDDTKRRMLADLKRFEAMRERLGALPTVEEFDQIKGDDTDAKLRRELMKVILRAHTLISHIIDEITKSADHTYDPLKGEKLHFLLREIVTLRDVVPEALAHEAVVTGAKKGGKKRGEQQQQEKAEKDEVEIMHGRGNVSEIINRLALIKDGLGDYLSPRDDLWPELFSKLDELGLRPKEDYDDSGKPLRIDYRDGNGKGGAIKFSSFKVMISVARKVK